MRFPNSPIILAGLAGLGILACTPDEVTKGVVGVASLPRVCPSAAKLDTVQMPSRIKFDPYVENRGVNDSTTPFTLYLGVTVVRDGAEVFVHKGTYISQNITVVGTHAVPGVSAGPEVELTTMSTIGSRSFSYDPAQTYSVTLDVQSNDNTFNTASEDCHKLGPLLFKGGQFL